MAKMINLIIADDTYDLDLYFKIDKTYYFILDFNKYDISFASYIGRKRMYQNNKFIEEL